MKRLVNESKPDLLKIIEYLSKDFESHKERSYLSKFLILPAINSEYSQDEMVQRLNAEVVEAQEKFKLYHKELKMLQQSTVGSKELIQEIHEMKQEKELLKNKIQKLMGIIDRIPDSKLWIQAAQELRARQLEAQSLEEQIQNQKEQSLQIESKIAAAKTLIERVPTANEVFAEVQAEYLKSKYMAEFGFNQQSKLAQEKANQVKMIMEKQVLREVDFEDIRAQIEQTKREIAELERNNEKRNELVQLEREYKDLEAKVASNGQRVLRGEELQNYIAQVRSKSMLYKQKKQDLATLTIQHNTLANELLVQLFNLVIAGSIPCPAR